MTTINRYCDPTAMDLLLRSRDGDAISLAPLNESERDHQRKHAITPTDFRIPVREEDEPCPQP